MTGDGAILFRHLQRMAFAEAVAAVNGSPNPDAAERDAPPIRRSKWRVICDGDSAAEPRGG